MQQKYPETWQKYLEWNKKTDKLANVTVKETLTHKTFSSKYGTLFILQTKEGIVNSEIKEVLKEKMEEKEKKNIKRRRRRI